MIRLKPGVSIVGIKPEISMALPIIASVYQVFGVDTVVTAGTDGKHRVGSLHYSGNALDIRTRNIATAAEKHEMCAKIAEALGKDFDVVLESTHLHVEFDPKDA
jgi:hypothetical protein